MKFGLALPYNQTKNIPEWARQAEEQGWDGLFWGDAIWCEDPMIGLAAAAMATSRIRLGTMIIPVPLRKPWKIASESVALDLLSDGRLILGIGTGAVWMGWQSFPDEVTDQKIRTEMLEETIDILTLMFQSKQFDYDGNQYHLKLSQLNEMYYPPTPVQAPRIPLWTPAIWPGEKSIQRALKCDGVILEKRSSAGEAAEVTPGDVREVKEYINEHGPANNPFDIVVDGKTFDLDEHVRQEKLTQMKDAGVTWWIEALWEGTVDMVVDCIQHGPPNRS